MSILPTRQFLLDAIFRAMGKKQPSGNPSDVAHPDSDDARYRRRGFNTSIKHVKRETYQELANKKSALFKRLPIVNMLGMGHCFYIEATDEAITMAKTLGFEDIASLLSTVRAKGGSSVELYTDPQYPALEDLLGPVYDWGCDEQQDIERPTP